MSAVGLARVREWREARAARVAFAPDGVLWACSTAQELQVYEGDELVATAAAPGEVLGELTFSLDGARVLVAPLAYEVAAREWAPRPPVLEALAVGLEPDAATGFAASAGAWAPDGSALAIYGEYRPPRGLPARGGWEGPSARLVLLEDGVPRVLWEGERSAPSRARCDSTRRRRGSRRARPTARSRPGTRPRGRRSRAGARTTARW